jgi:hypothetical protein
MANVELMMKKTAIFFLVFVFLMSQAFTAFASEKIVQLTVPGCFS